MRLIATDDQEIKNSIIKATNRQTQVSDDQLVALTDFPRKLEAFFPTYDGKKKLYYERRSRQYNNQEGVEKVRIISMTTLVRSYASLFMKLPHRTTRNYKSLLKTIGSDIFNPSDVLEMYYLSAYCHFRLEQLFRSQTIDRKLKVCRYHMLMVVIRLSTQDEIPRMKNSNEMRRFCNKVLDKIWDDIESEQIFTDAAQIVCNAAEGNFDRDIIRTEPFTEKVIAEIDKYIS